MCVEWVVESVAGGSWEVEAKAAKLLKRIISISNYGTYYVARRRTFLPLNQENVVVFHSLPCRHFAFIHSPFFFLAFSIKSSIKNEHENTKIKNIFSTKCGKAGKKWKICLFRRLFSLCFILFVNSNSTLTKRKILMVWFVLLENREKHFVNDERSLLMWKICVFKISCCFLSLFLFLEYVSIDSEFSHNICMRYNQIEWALFFDWISVYIWLKYFNRFSVIIEHINLFSFEVCLAELYLTFRGIVKSNYLHNKSGEILTCNRHTWNYHHRICYMGCITCEKQNISLESFTFRCVYSHYITWNYFVMLSIKHKHFDVSFFVFRQKVESLAARVSRL